MARNMSSRSLLARQAIADMTKPSRTSQRSTSSSCSRRNVSISNSRSSATASLPRFLPAEHRADLGAAVAATPRPEARLSLRRIIRAARALDDSTWGDALGALFVFVAGYGLILIAGVLG